MTAARPFRGLRYDPKRVALSDVIVPPYDVIAADERGAFFDRDPHNAIRFELTRDASDEAATDYGWIRQTMDAWRESGVLVEDETPGYYVMRQTYKAPSGEVLSRVGFFAELGLEEYDARIVRPHERTLEGPKADRLKLLRAAEANLSSVFLLYEDRDDELAAILETALERGELGRASDGAGVDYVLARLVEPEAVARIEAFMAQRPTVIADGHHRYETALNYRREQAAATQQRGAAAAAPWQSTIAYFANAYAAGSLLLPIHRVVRSVPAPSEAEWRTKLAGWIVTPLADGREVPIDEVLARHLAPHANAPSFVAETAAGALFLIRRDEALAPRLMVRILETEILGGVFGLDPDAIRGGAVSFPKSAARAAREVRDGEGTIALYLNAMRPDDVFRTTEEGEVMPQKSTFFYPKIPTGMVFRDHRSRAATRGERAR